MFKVFRRVVLVLSAGLLLTTLPACTGAIPPQQIPGTTVPTANTQPITLELKKRYFQALTIAKGLNTAAELAVDMGLLTPGSKTAVTVADLLNDLKKAMDAADTAFKVNNAIRLEANVRNMDTITASIKGLLGLK